MAKRAPRTPPRGTAATCRGLAVVLLACLCMSAAWAVDLPHRLDLDLSWDESERLGAGLYADLGLPAAARLGIDGSWQAAPDGGPWSSLGLSLDSDPVAPLAVGTWGRWQAFGADLEQQALGPRLTLAPGAWQLRLEGDFRRLRLRLRRPLLRQDRIDVFAAGGRLEVLWYGLVPWSFRAGFGWQDYSRDLGFFAANPALAWRLFTPGVLDQSYALERRRYQLGLARHGPRQRLALDWERLVSAVDGRPQDLLGLTLERRAGDHAALALALGLGWDAAGTLFFLRPMVSIFW